jgi:hypothetical protein
MDGQTNMKLIVVFRNFANAPKKKPYFEKWCCLLNYPRVVTARVCLFVCLFVCLCVCVCVQAIIHYSRSWLNWGHSNMLFRVVGGNAVDIAEVQHRYVSGFVMPVGILLRCSTAFSSSQCLRLLRPNSTLTWNVNTLSIKDAVFCFLNLWQRKTIELTVKASAHELKIQPV